MLFNLFLLLGNVPALRKLLQAYVKRGANEIVSSGSLVSSTMLILF